jgi:hypothetical protein
MRTLDEALRELHRRGGWITAWYPLSDGDFEVRVSYGSGDHWAVDADALLALNVVLDA